jgi:hypothetical protein
MWCYRVNLDKRVRRDHPLRRINEVLDLGFVREQVAHTYGRQVEVKPDLWPDKVTKRKRCYVMLSHSLASAPNSSVAGSHCRQDEQSGAD